MLLQSLVFASILFSRAQEQQDFTGHQVLRVLPTQHKHIRFLQRLENNLAYQLDFWKEPYYKNHEVDFRVPREEVVLVKSLLTKHNVPFNVLIEDLQKVIEFELDSNRVKRDTQDVEEDDVVSFLNKYNSHADINSWLERTSNKCGPRCALSTIGRTYDGRELKVIKITNGRQSGNKSAIWLDGGIHGREWISPAVAVNFIYKLINDTTDRCTKALLDNFDWYILPVANPDGYEYSRNRNRMWRKNRRPTAAPRRPWWGAYHYGSNLKHCYGVDLNRNFGFYWGETGTSTNPCSDIYGGPEPFSEPESLAIKDFLQSIGTVQVYLSLHAYGQYWLYSWGFTRQLNPDHHDLDRVANQGANAIYVASGREALYTVGSAARTLYASSGASDDWAKGSLGAKFSFTLELPPSDADNLGNGFILPASAIPSIVSETWPGIQAMAAKTLQVEGGRSRSATVCIN